MPCSACNHIFSAAELLREFNPIRFVCPQCSATLTLDWIGWLLLGTACVIAIPLALFAANQYTAGTWSLVQSLLVLAIFLLAVFTAELIYARFARFPRREPKRNAA